MDSNDNSKWVCYYRCSTERKGRSGLGLEAQMETVARFLASRRGTVIAEYTEVESGRKNNRPMLAEALAIAKKEKAVLVIAKLDRLARNVFFISGLLESGIEFVAADLPQRSKFLLHLTASFAEEEARLISERTRQALAAAKARGVPIGVTGKILAARHKREAVEKARSYGGIIAGLRNDGAITTRATKDALNDLGILSPGGGRWHIRNTYLLLKRLGHLG